MTLHNMTEGKSISITFIHNLVVHVVCFIYLLVSQNENIFFANSNKNKHFKSEGQSKNVIDFCVILWLEVLHKSSVAYLVKYQVSTICKKFPSVKGHTFGKIY